MGNAAKGTWIGYGCEGRGGGGGRGEGDDDRSNRIYEGNYRDCSPVSSKPQIIARLIALTCVIGYFAG